MSQRYGIKPHIDYPITDWKHHKMTGMPLKMYKERMQCPDCGAQLIKSMRKGGHFVYSCLGCHCMLKDKGNKTSWKCREW